MKFVYTKENLELIIKNYLEQIKDIKQKDKSFPSEFQIQHIVDRIKQMTYENIEEKESYNRKNTKNYLDRKSWWKFWIKKPSVSNYVNISHSQKYAMDNGFCIDSEVRDEQYIEKVEMPSGMNYEFFFMPRSDIRLAWGDTTTSFYIKRMPSSDEFEYIMNGLNKIKDDIERNNTGYEFIYLDSHGSYQCYLRQAKCFIDENS